jgi:secretion/DNA translocation related CpaE-like protein
MSNEGNGPCIGVLGGSGGVGASCLAAAIAACAVPAVLVDLDVYGGGIDVLLGIEKEAGTRWSGLHSDGGRIDPGEVAEALPRWGEVSVLSCDRNELPAAAVGSVLVAARALGPVVVDLGRGRSAAKDMAVADCDLVAVVVRATVPGVAAAARVIARRPRWHLVVAPGGSLSRRKVSAALGAVEVLAFDFDRALADTEGAGLDASALRRSTRALAGRLLGEAQFRRGAA